MDLIKGFGRASSGFQFRSANRVGPGSWVATAYASRQFEDGLNESIKRYLAPIIAFQQVNFYQLKVEKSESSSGERFQKRKISR